MDNQPEICFVASEMYPFSKSGGLADVIGILPLTMHKMGFRVCVITPLYGRILTANFKPRLVYEDLKVGYPWPETTTDIYRADFKGMPVYFLERGEYFDRRYYYCTYKGDYFDNCERFIFFCRAAMSLMQAFKTPPKIVHSHDWHAALVNPYLYYQRRFNPYWKNTSTVFSIHNLAFQGRFSVRLFWDCGLPYEAWNMNGVEYYDSFNMLKGGIAYADKITTVSPSYAEEIITPEFGCGLEGILQTRSSDLQGILNGSDYEIWDPSKDRFLEANYSYDDLYGKHLCKKDLLKLLNLSDKLLSRPVLGFIGRLRDQKGIDLLMELIPELVSLNVGVVILGEGDFRYENELMNMVERFLGHVAGIVGYTEEMAHKIQAGTDIFLMPSRYEPCGLTQMYSLRYGTPPVATAVGGLKDTIIPYPDENATGFIFQQPLVLNFFDEIKNALNLYQDADAWKEMIIRGMRADFSWRRSAEEYIQLYRDFGYDL